MKRLQFLINKLNWTTEVYQEPDLLESPTINHGDRSGYYHLVSVIYWSVIDGQDSLLIHPHSLHSAIIIGTLGFVHVTTNLIRNVILGGSDSNLTLSQLIDKLNSDYGWTLKILVNLFGYSCVIVPGLLIFQYTKRTQYLDRCGWLSPLLFLLLL